MCVVAASIVLTGSSLGTGTSATNSYQCSLPRYSDAESANRQDSFEFSVLVDAESNKASLAGADAIGEVQLIHNEAGGISLFEVTMSGNVSLTTIAKDGTAVHSRHAMIDGALQSSQHYGRCNRK